MLSTSSTLKLDEAPRRLQNRRLRLNLDQLWIKAEYPASLLSALEGPCVAIVGARACSEYGRSVARSLARELAEEGITIVSGLARGIDAEAHRGALDGDGVTVGVLGCGIDVVYPAAHNELAIRMFEKGGGLLSEYEPGVPPAPWRFPARNRIIAGLADVVVVVEARERSGALITADFALEVDVPVLAVPGEITALLSAGTNGLLRREGVEICLSPTDVIETLDVLGATA
jgi:DNA processing protein